MNIRHISGISIAMVVGAVFLGILMLATGTVTAFSRSPAEFLPADNTIAVFHNADAALVSKYSSWLPIVEDIPLEEPTTVAIVQTGTGTLSLITFTKRVDTSTPLEFWPYVVHAQLPAARELLQKRLQPLMRQPGYRDFSRTKAAKDQWVFLRPNALPQEKTLYASMVRALLFQDASTVSMSHATNGVTIELHKPKADFATVNTPMPSFPNSALTLQVSNGTDIVERSWQTLPQENQYILSAVLRTFIQEHFGHTVSGQYDVLPLAKNTLDVSVSKNASGALFVYAAGAHDNKNALTKIVERLQQGRQSIQPLTEVLDMQLDSQFRMRSLRMSNQHNDDTLRIEHEENHYTLTNTTADSLEATPFPLEARLLAGSIRSRGYASLSELQELLHTYLQHQKQGVDTPLSADSATSVQWIWEERGNLAIIRLLFSS